MEEAIASQPNLTSSLPTQTQAPKPSRAAEPQLSKLPPSTTHSFTPNNKKRPLENAILESSDYRKMRTVIEGLRHRFLEVIRSPNYRSCRASCDIQTELKVLIDLCKHMKTEISPPEKHSSATGGQHSSDSQEAFTKKAKHEHDPQVDRPCVDKPTQSVLDRGHADDSEGRGSYVVGGSAFGWNFIIFRSFEKAVYYGVTKEQFRADGNLSTRLAQSLK